MKNIIKSLLWYCSRFFCRSFAGDVAAADAAVDAVVVTINPLYHVYIVVDVVFVVAQPQISIIAASSTDIKCPPAKDYWLRRTHFWIPSRRASMAHVSFGVYIPTFPTVGLGANALARCDRNGMLPPITSTKA